MPSRLFRHFRWTAKNRGTSRPRRTAAPSAAHPRLEALEQRHLLTAGIALDPTFGQGGLVKTDIIGPSSDTAASIAITQPDGKIVVAGDAQQPAPGNRFLLVRYDADGSLDPTFGNGGFVTSGFGDHWNAYGMAIDGGGHIIVVGDAFVDSGEHAAIVEYNSDGTLNTAFGEGGIVTTGFGNVVATARGVAIDPAGNIDITGDTLYQGTQRPHGYELFVARFKPDGAADTTFGTGGDTLTDVGSYGNAVALDAAGDLVVAGQRGTYNNSQAVVARFTSAGTLDTTFNGTGYATTNFGLTNNGAPAPAVANAVAIDANQEIVIAGDTPSAFFPPDETIGLARYTSQGTLDPTFGSGGETTRGNYGDSAQGLAIDPAGNIVVAATIAYQKFAALRFTPQGALDHSFGVGGEADVNFGSSYFSNQAASVALTSAGQILLAGQVNNATNINQLALARLNGNGTIDDSFGPNSNGTTVSEFQISELNFANAMAIESDGKIVTAGKAWSSAGTQFTVSRFNEGGTPDDSFGGSGTITTDTTGGAFVDSAESANAVAIDSQQRIVVAGQAAHAGGGTDIALARYEPDGTLDTSFGDNGIVITSLAPGSENEANALSILANGDILVGGMTTDGQDANHANFALLRYTSDGQLDTTFGGMALGGGPGWVQTDFGAADSASSMVVQPDGKIVLAGSTAPTFGYNDANFALARYNSDGSLDTSFGASGKVTTNFGTSVYGLGTSNAYAVTLDDQGRIIVAGASDAASQGGFRFALARYDSNGTLDSSFGSGGMVLSGPQGFNYARSVIVTPAGKILAGGYGLVSGQGFNFMIARYNDDGSLDATFAPGSSAAPAGMAVTGFGVGAAGNDEIEAMALDHEGRLVAAGSTLQPATYADTALARYVLDSTLTASAGGPYTINEGDSLALSATAAGGDGGPLTYSWDVNGDGTFGQVTGNNPTLTWAQLEALGIDDGPATFQVSVRVSDAHGEYIDSAATTLTVNDTPPTPSVSGPAAEVVGQPQTFSLAATDPSSVDTAAGFSFLVNWGDGSPTQTVAGPVAASQLSHVFTSSGDYTIEVWATDKDGKQSPSPATLTAAVQAAALEGGTLVVGGNNILLQAADANGGIAVTVGGASQGVFDPTDEIVIYGLSGGDNIQLQGAGHGHHALSIAVGAVIFGGDGNDTIDARGSSANDVLVGGAGDDLLYGGSGRNLLIGGGGSDTLYGGGGDDILIGGGTVYDANLAALNAIMAEWGRTDLSYQQREADLSGAASGGLNGSYVLNGSTVYDDGVVDVLAGGHGHNWYFAGIGDQQVSGPHDRKTH